MVYLVGAGPGDPGLLTLKGREALSRADVVIYDYLANEDLLAHLPPGAERIYVGKQGGDHTLRQDEINRLLVEKGRAHAVVVRLKGGDPFIFGRGGEEAEELVSAGVPFEVVPGVTAGVAAAAYAGIPLTHRDHAQSVAFVTGHERGDALGPSRIQWEKLATGVGTLVFYMGVKNLPEIASRLIAGGRPAETPVAVIRWGTTPLQRTVSGKLSDIVERVRAAGLTAPAIIVVGSVCGLRESLGWFERRPLFGRTVIVTRAREQGSAFRAALEALGARCIEFPTISIAPPESFEPLDRAIGNLSGYQWVVFTSPNGVARFFERLRAAGRDARTLSGQRVAAIGPGTAAALQGCGIAPDVIPAEYRAEGLLEAFGGEAVRGVRFLVPRAAEAREVLPETLRGRGAEVDVVAAYRTVLPGRPTPEVLEALRAGEAACVTFTSSSTVRNFVALLAGEDLSAHLAHAVVACIGPVTAKTARALGLRVTLEPAEYTIPALVSAIREHFLNAGAAPA